ncbi:Leucine carboxyl methyltransferase 2 [Theileria orientalis]|uniref:Leucine carboxyl methyltransferase 1 n=1 Tax=Theileria orientalis TaxID=68886 RepID=A0A976QSI5_THEOR|nr:Leucine carboxyl methyltransferase 2 [Theileria orientalis]
MGLLDIKKSAKTAILTRRSSKDLGYFEDEYLDFFSTKSRSPPSINLATYLRVSSLRLCFDEFFEYFKNERVQFLCLGTGLDTTPYHFLETYDNVVCFDHDFEEVMKSKAQIMQKNKKFIELLPGLRASGYYVTSERYKMVPFDLNHFDKISVLLDSGISGTLPTLILSDLCMSHLKTESSNKLLQWFADFFKGPVLYLCLEQLTKDGEKNEFEDITGWISHSSIDYPTKESQTKRYTDLGWDGFHIKFGAYFYNRLSLSERERVLKIENFTQMELLDNICHLFFLGFAFKNFKDPIFFDFLFHEISATDSKMVSLGNDPLPILAIGRNNAEFAKFYTELSETPIDCVPF